MNLLSDLFYNIRSKNCNSEKQKKEAVEKSNKDAQEIVTKYKLIINKTATNDEIYSFVEDYIKELYKDKMSISEIKKLLKERIEKIKEEKSFDIDDIFNRSIKIFTDKGWLGWDENQARSFTGLMISKFKDRFKNDNEILFEIISLLAIKTKNISTEELNPGYLAEALNNKDVIEYVYRPFDTTRFIDEETDKALLTIGLIYENTSIKESKENMNKFIADFKSQFSPPETIIIMLEVIKDRYLGIIDDNWDAVTKEFNDRCTKLGFPIRNTNYIQTTFREQIKKKLPTTRSIDGIFNPLLKGLIYQEPTKFKSEADSLFKHFKLIFCQEENEIQNISMKKVKYNFDRIHEEIVNNHLLRQIHEMGHLNRKQKAKSSNIEEFIKILQSKSKSRYKFLTNNIKTDDKLKIIILNQPTSYYIDDLSKKKYEKIRRDYYCEEGKIIDLLGIYNPVTDKIIIDINKIKSTAEDLKVKEGLLREVVLMHELGHRFTRHTLKPNLDNWIRNTWYQEYYAQRFAYLLLHDDEKVVMKKLSKQQPHLYNTYKNVRLSKKISKIECLLKLNREICNVRSIQSEEVLEEEIERIKIKSDDEFIGDLHEQCAHVFTRIALKDSWEELGIGDLV